MRAVARADDPQSQELLREILLTKRYAAAFARAGQEPWQAEAAFVQWQQYAAIKAAERADAFGPTLVAYYFSTLAPEAASSSTTGSERLAEAQIRAAALRLVRQGDLYTAILDTEAEELGVPPHRYDVGPMASVGADEVTVDAAFVRGHSSRKYRIHFRRFAVGDQLLWLPMKKQEHT